jgi:hypothetical protein
MKKSDKPSRVVDKSNLLVKYVGIKDIPQNSEMFSKLKSVTYEEEDVVVNSNIENLTLYRIHVRCLFPHARIRLYREVRYSKFRNHGRFAFKERGKAYYSMIVTVANIVMTPQPHQISTLCPPSLICPPNPSGVFLESFRKVIKCDELTAEGFSRRMLSGLEC